MQTQSGEKRTIEEQLSYWKWDFTAHDLFSNELAYSLIYDNIRPDRVADALRTVGLETLPNYFLLLQIDDYLSLSKQLEITREFFQKDLVVNTIRDYLKELSLPGFSANLINSDRVICFLCLEEERHAPIQDFLQTFITEIRRRVRLHTPYTLSASISGECTSLSHYPKMYLQMEQALEQSFYRGEGASLDRKSDAKAPTLIDLNKHYTALLAAVSQCSEPRIDALTAELFQELEESRLPPQQVRIELVRLIHRFGDYCAYCGVPEQTSLTLSGQYVEWILASQFFSHIQQLFNRFCHKAAHMLAQYSSDQEYQFQAPIRVYISEHYQHTIRLEDIAQAFNFSVGYFACVFKREFGVTFIQYLTEFRIERAKELLIHSNLPIESVAFRVGFNSYSYFSTTFKRLTGMTPKEYQYAAKAGELLDG